VSNANGPASRAAKRSDSAAWVLAAIADGLPLEQATITTPQAETTLIGKQRAGDLMGLA